MLKVRCFKTTGDNRPFLSKFYVKLGLSNHNVPSGPSANPYVEARSAELTRGGLQFLCVLLLNKLAITKLGCYVFYLEASSAIVQISLCI